MDDPRWFIAFAIVTMVYFFAAVMEFGRRYRVSPSGAVMLKLAGSFAGFAVSLAMTVILARVMF